MRRVETRAHGEDLGRGLDLTIDPPRDPRGGSTWKTQRVQSEWGTGRFADVGRVVGEVQDHRGVARLIEAMRADLAQDPGAWENHTLDRYLESLGAVIDARGEAIRQPTWQLVAELLVIASGYE